MNYLLLAAVIRPSLLLCLAVLNVVPACDVQLEGGNNVLIKGGRSHIFTRVHVRGQDYGKGVMPKIWIGQGVKTNGYQRMHKKMCAISCLFLCLYCVNYARQDAK